MIMTGENAGLRITLFSCICYEEKSLFTPREFLKEKKNQFLSMSDIFLPKGYWFHTGELFLSDTHWELLGGMSFMIQ